MAGNEPTTVVNSVIRPAGIEFVVVKSMGVPVRIRKQTQQRDAAGLCIACGDSSRDPKTGELIHPQKKRKVCTRCHGRFQMNRPPKSNPVKRARYEAAAEAAGLIGPSRQGERGDLDQYRKIAAQAEKAG